MSIIKVSPNSTNYPYLRQGGIYGRGQQHDCKVECVSFIAPTEPGDGPGYDRDCSKEEAPYGKFVFRVHHPEWGTITVSDWQAFGENSGSKLLSYIANLTGDQSVTETGEFDPSQVAPRECTIEVTDPNPAKDGSGRMYSGYIRNVVGVN